MMKLAPNLLRRMVTVNADYNENVARFFAIARERHLIYLRRKAGLSAPWTTDPILGKYKFTNVFRELDRTTAWFRENVRDRYADSPACLFATLVFRLFNRIETGRAIFGQGDMFDGSPFELFIKSHLQYGSNDPHLAVQDLKKAISAGIKPGQPTVTGAYIIKTPEGMTKLDGVLWIIAEALRGEMKVRGKKEKAGHASLWDWGQYMIDTEEPLPIQTATAWLERLPYIGHFTAYEITTDLRHTRLLDRAPDIMTWANPGPGCRRGLKRMYGDAKNAYIGSDDEIQRLMRGLLKESQDPRSWPQRLAGGGYATEGYELPPEYQGEGDFPHWEMREVEMWLCEFDKNERVRLGEGKPRGTYFK